VTGIDGSSITSSAISRSRSSRSSASRSSSRKRRSMAARSFTNGRVPRWSPTSAMQLQAGQPAQKGNKRGAAYPYNIKELREAYYWVFQCQPTSLRAGIAHPRWRLLKLGNVAAAPG